MKIGGLLKKLLPDWADDPVDRGLDELLALDEPKRRAIASLEDARKRLAHQIEADLESGKSVAHAELSAAVLEGEMRLKIIEEVFLRKRDKIAGLIARGAAGRKGREETIRQRTLEIYQEKRRELLKAVLDFARRWGIESAGIKPPTRHMGGTMPIPAWPLPGEPDPAEWLKLKAEAEKETYTPLYEAELKALTNESQRLTFADIQPPHEAVNVLLDRRRRGIDQAGGGD